MQIRDKKTRLEVLENRVQQNLGRELTPRDKFYLAMAEACTPHEPAAKKKLPRTARAIRDYHLQGAAEKG